jgi:hypothetical protein
MEDCGEVISLTLGDQGENHVGMEKVGSMVPEGEGFNLGDFKKYRKIFKKAGYVVVIHYLNRLVGEETEVRSDMDDAYVMIVRKGMNYFLEPIGKTDEDLFEEMDGFEWDRKYFCTRRKKVLNKHARANVCFGDESREPDYENKKGRIVGYDGVGCLKTIKSGMADTLGDKCGNLICEGNRYFDLKKCGIGWHGDAERRKVVAFRIGEDMDLRFNWFQHHSSFGELFSVTLNSGDMYMMSEKAVGTDWKRSSIPTLRHSAGKPECKYVKLRR